MTAQRWLLHWHIELHARWVRELLGCDGAWLAQMEWSELWRESDPEYRA